MLNIRQQMHIFTKRMLAVVVLFLMVLCSMANIAHAGIDTGLSGDDSAAGPFPIGFEFNYYGNTVRQFYASTNGLLQFANPSTAYNNSCNPSIDNTLYVFWDDLRTNASGQQNGTIKYETLGEAPYRKLVVQWTNQYFYGSDLPMGTFQAVLFESSNEIKYQYRFLVDERSKGNSATVGMRGVGSGQMLQIGCNQNNVLTEQQAISFTPDATGLNYTVNPAAHYDFIDIAGLTPSPPLALGQFTNDVPSWTWNKISSLNKYEIEIQDQNYDVIHTETLGNVGLYSYVAGFEHSKKYYIRVRGSINNGGTWEVWSGLSALLTIDTENPKIATTVLRQTSASTAQISWTASDDLSGLNSIKLEVANDANFTTLIRSEDLSAQTTHFDIDNIALNESIYVRVQAKDNAGNVSDYTDSVGLHFIAPAIPTLSSPVMDSVYGSAQVLVSGNAENANQVQLFLNNEPVNPLLTALTNASGATTFSTYITLPAEGHYILDAQAINFNGSSQRSSPINFSYDVPLPSVGFITPSEAATVNGNITVSVNALDVNGISQVQIKANGQTLATLTQPPYQTVWDTRSRADASYALTAVATNKAGKQSQASRTIQVQNTPPPPVLPVYPWSGKILHISPAQSLGDSPITISGTTQAQNSTQVVPNAPLRLNLRTSQGAQRSIGLNADAAGQFSTRFIPQASDAGNYEAWVVHPDDRTYTSQAAQGSFTINRLNFNYNRYTLNAIKGQRTKVAIQASASAGTGATGVHWRAAAADQPSGSLPAGISLDLSEQVDVGAGSSQAVPIYLTASATPGAAPESGTIILKAYASESGDTPRTELRLDYQLHEAKPGLSPSPSILELGVQQGQVESGTVTITNKGLSAAHNVKVQLVDSAGNAPPAWVYLASASELGSLGVGQSATLQITAQPAASQADGYFNYQLKISADNDAGGIVPVTIAVVQSGQGHAKFRIVNLYTGTLDGQGQLIPGLAGASIKLQNEAVTAVERSVVTDAQGEARIQDLPPGIYRWRISAKNHSDTSGRLHIKAGLTTSERVFMDYKTVSIEFTVTETTIKDEYDIVLEAIFQTQVPAPVVLMEPLSIKLPEMQVGEEITGEITLSNYGLVRADGVVFTPPSTDAYYKYEFFGDVPTELAAKSRHVIPYRITALQVMGRGTRVFKDMAVAQDPMGAVRRSIQAMLDGKNPGNIDSAKVAAIARGSSCGSYSVGAILRFLWDCAGGDTRNGSAVLDISSGGAGGSGSCGGGGSPGSSGSGGPGASQPGTGWGEGSWSGGGFISLTFSCTPFSGGGPGPNGGGGGPGPGPGPNGGGPGPGPNGGGPGPGPNGGGPGPGPNGGGPGPGPDGGGPDGDDNKDEPETEEEDDDCK